MADRRRKKVTKRHLLGGGVAIVVVVAPFVVVFPSQVDVVAAVLVYRVMTMVPTLVIDLLAGVTWKRYRPDYVEADA